MAKFDHFESKTWRELHDIQKVFIEDYRAVEAEVVTLGKDFQSGGLDLSAYLAAFEDATRRCIGIHRDINELGAMIDRKDGTAGT